MGISESTLDNHLSTARGKVKAAEETLNALRDIDETIHPPVPSECFECGEELAGPFVQTEAGEPQCLDCADVDPSELEI